MVDITVHERIARGQQAQRLIDELRPHVERVEAKYIEWWTLSQSPEEREAIWHRFQALQAMMTDIFSAIADGHIATQEQLNEH